jgi:type II secretory pathway pseudopilin PulG
MRRRGPTSLRGFTYLGVLFIVSLLALSAAAASAVWSVVQQRDKEVELVFAGRQFAAAIERYRARSDRLAEVPARVYPDSLDALLSDDRALLPMHHLRRLYIDPMTGEAQWGLIRLPGGGIVGVHSLSTRRPYPRTFVTPDFSTPATTAYRDWHFMAPSAQTLLP